MGFNAVGAKVAVDSVRYMDDSFLLNPWFYFSLFLILAVMPARHTLC